MNLNHLAVFHAIAQSKSVSRGAERLMISQPAASKQLRELERALKTTLLQRLPRGVRLTQAGEVLAGHAARLFAIADEAEVSMGDLRGLRRGRLRVVAGTTIGVYLLPEAFVRVRREYPGVELQLEMASSDVACRRLMEGQADIALLEALPAEVASLRLQTSIFRTDELVPIARPDHALGKERRIFAAALCAQPFVVREVGSGSKSLVERVLAEKGLRVTPVMSLSSTEAIKRAVAAGMGVAIVSRMSVGMEVQAKCLTILRVADLKISRPLYAVRADDGSGIPIIDILLREVSAAAPAKLQGSHAKHS